MRLFFMSTVAVTATAAYFIAAVFMPVFIMAAATAATAVVFMLVLVPMLVLMLVLVLVFVFVIVFVLEGTAGELGVFFFVLLLRVAL